MGDEPTFKEFIRRMLPASEHARACGRFGVIPDEDMLKAARVPVSDDAAWSLADGVEWPCVVSPLGRLTRAAIEARRMCPPGHKVVMMPPEETEDGFRITWRYELDMSALFDDGMSIEYAVVGEEE